MKLLPHWVSIAAIVIGGLMIMCSVAESNRIGTEEALIFAANVLAGGMIVSTGILSLTLLKIFGKNDKEK